MSKPDLFETAWLRLILEGNTNDGIMSAFGVSVTNDTGSSGTNLYLSLHTNIVTEVNATGQNENEVPVAVYSNYLRQAISRTNGAWTILSNASNAGVAQNVSTVTFPQHTGATTVTCTYWALGSTNSGPGTVCWSGPMATEDTRPFIVNDTGTNALTNFIQCLHHGYAAQSRVVFISYPGSSNALPSGITEGYAYYVVSTNIQDDHFRISTNAASAFADIGSGEGLVAQIVPLVITQNSIPRVLSNQIVITED